MKSIVKKDWFKQNGKKEMHVLVGNNDYVNFFDYEKGEKFEKNFFHYP